MLTLDVESNLDLSIGFYHYFYFDIIISVWFFSWHTSNIFTCLVQTDHGPKVVGHLLAILQDGPEEEVPPGVFAALLQLSQVLLGVEQSALGRLFLENIGPLKYYGLFYVGVI